MAFNFGYQEFCDRWIEKAKSYKETDLNQCFDKFFTLFVVYNALYVETAALLSRKAASEGRDEYKLEGVSSLDSRAATKYVLAYLKSSILLGKLEADENSREAIGTLTNLIETAHFYIFLDPVWGEPQRDEDNKILGSLKSGNKDKRASAILKIIYQVRCNMFHGRKGLDPVQKELLVPILRIVEKIIEVLYEQLKKEKYIQKPSSAENS